MDPLPVTINQFRELFMEFSDSSVFLDEMIEPWLIIACSLLDPRRWGSVFTMGVGLFVAHQLTLRRQAILVANRGGVPGLSVGIVQSKSINGVSVSYNTSMGLIANAGDWNLSVYGIQFIGFARMFGSGGVQLVGVDAVMVTEAQLIQGNVPFPQF